MTRPLQEVLVDKIRAGGPIPFAAYMQLALYHPHHGYYSSGKPRTGWGGHFVTSPELDPAFGALWAVAFQQVWEACGRPSEFHVIELGPGEGGMAAGVVEAVDAPFADALHLDLIERSPEVEKRQRHALSGFDRAEWHRSIAELPARGAGCFFANEVLDNLPVHLVTKEAGELREICITEDDGRLVEVSLPTSNPELGAFVARCGVDLPEGHRFEVHLAAESLIDRARAAIERGCTIFVDYGSTATELAQRGNGSLVCYSAAGADDSPLEGPGSKDITVHANWTAVAAALEAAGDQVVGPIQQRAVLKRLGLDAFHEALREEFRTASAAGEGATALRALSRRQALGALADPDGLGGLEVVMGTRGIAPPPFTLA
ncbi:MAG: class I SAM-dependent methyltransferase [Actinomycetota bacterium]